jgi:hypothetical protein
LQLENLLQNQDTRRVIFPGSDADPAVALNAAGLQTANGDIAD